MITIRFDESTNKDLLAGTLQELYDNTDRAKLVEYPEVFKEVKTSDYYFRKMRIAGLPHGGEVADGANIPTYDPTYGQTKDWTQVRFGSGFTITKMMKKFNRYDLMEKFTRDLKKCEYEMKDIKIAQLINAPTATTYGSGFDGLSIANNSHTNLDATTYDNRGDVDLSVTGLSDAYIYFDTIVDDTNKIAPAVPNKLIVTPQDQIRARQLVGSDKVPFSLENTKNIFPEWDLKLFVYHRMTDADQWMLAATEHENYGLFVATSQDPDFVVQDAPNTSRNTYCTSEQMFSYGFSDARYIYISIGA